MRISHFMYLVVASVLALSCQKLQAQSSKQYYISFMARNASLRPFSIGGHAFIAWATSPVGDTVAAVRKSLGFYPQEGSSILTLVVEKRRGRIVRGFRTNSRDMILRHFSIAVDSATWYDTQCLGDVWNYQPYNLLNRNCVHFINEVAERCELELPRTTTLLFGFPRKPFKYVRNLQRRNRKLAVRMNKIQLRE